MSIILLISRWIWKHKFGSEFNDIPETSIAEVERMDVAIISLGLNMYVFFKGFRVAPLWWSRNSSGVDLFSIFHVGAFEEELVNVIYRFSQG